MYTLRIGIDYELMAFQRFQMRREVRFSVSNRVFM